MTIESFTSNNKIKNKNRVVDWINNGYIPNANVENNYIPDSARPPYTKARAKNTNAIYVSIVTASYNRKHVIPALYKICDDEFNGYINRLVDAGLIEKRISDDVTYYDATVEVNDFNRKFIINAIKAVLEGLAYGTTKAILSKVGA